MHLTRRRRCDTFHLQTFWPGTPPGLLFFES